MELMNQYGKDEIMYFVERIVPFPVVNAETKTAAVVLGVTMVSLDESERRDIALLIEDDIAVGLGEAVEQTINAAIEHSKEGETEQ